MSSSHRVVLDRAVLATEVVGSGEPVVFLHAAICDRRMWRAQLIGVGARNKAIAYDRRGFGETSADREDFSAVADLMAVIDAMADGKPAILVACSDGGQIALDAALRHPSFVRALARFLDMNGLALRSPPIGANLDVAPAFHRLAEISVPTLVMSGDLDLLNIQERSRHVAA